MIQFQQSDLGFNRYIVECKSNKLGIGTEKYERFNRYIVECKFQSKLNINQAIKI